MLQLFCSVHLAEVVPQLDAVLFIVSAKIYRFYLGFKFQWFINCWLLQLVIY